MVLFLGSSCEIPEDERLSVSVQKTGAYVGPQPQTQSAIINDVLFTEWALLLSLCELYAYHLHEEFVLCKFVSFVTKIFFL